MKSTIFLSYPSSLEQTAAALELALKGEGYKVFRDRSALPPGESFDARIQAAVEDSDLFVFLITPDSVTPGRYTLTVGRGLAPGLYFVRLSFGSDARTTRLCIVK